MGEVTEKEKVEREHSQKMNGEAVERIKRETADEARRVEGVFFEDDEEITLRNGEKFRIAPLTLKDARKLMKLLKAVNVDAIILNFVPSEDEVEDEQRSKDLLEMLKLAFKSYDWVDVEYIDENVDLNTARKLVEIMIGLNGLKK